MKYTDYHPLPGSGLSVCNTCGSKNRKYSLNYKNPLVPKLEKINRFITNGLRGTIGKSISLNSYLPLLIVALLIFCSVNDGITVLFICCSLTIYLLRITGWKNEKIK